MNFFPGKLTRDGEKMLIDTGDFKVQIPADMAKPYKEMSGQDVVFGIRPENIFDPEFVAPNIKAEKVNARVEVTELMGNETLLYLTSKNHSFVSRVDPRSKLRVGNSTQMLFDMAKCHIFDAKTEKAIR
jgi:multiple sugar transport system ATP-binding protein